MWLSFVSFFLCLLLLDAGCVDSFVVSSVKSYRSFPLQRQRQQQDSTPTAAAADNDNTIDDEDDDDISQHTLMSHNYVDSNNNATATSSRTTGGTGYRPIEDWHEENHNPRHVLDSLKREQARWKSKFEDLGGDGI